MIKIIDDFLPEPLFERLNNAVTSFDFPWFYLKDTTYRNKYSDNEALWDDGFSCLIYLQKVDENFEFKCPAYDEFVPLLAHCEFALGSEYKMNALARVKANLTTTSITEEPFEPHVDQPDVAMKTAILYMNDSSGPTYIYDYKCPVGSTTNKALEIYRKNKDEFKVLVAVPPKRNRMILFDGDYYHSGSRPTTNKYRININFNWFAKTTE
jgi:hypothetical protein